MEREKGILNSDTKLPMIYFVILDMTQLLQQKTLAF